MEFSLFIAMRYLFAWKGGRKLVSASTCFTILGVAVGVGALIVTMSIMNGFTTTLRDKMIGVTAHGYISSMYVNTKESPELLQTIRSTPGVRGATPFIYSELMLSTPYGVKGVMLRGIDPDTGAKVLGVLQKLTYGSVEDLKTHEGLPGIIVGRELARKLHLSLGSRVNLLAPSGQQGATGFNPRIKPFKVVGIFSIDLYAYDTSLVFTSLESARAMLNMPERVITGVEIAVDDVYEANATIDEIISRLGPDYQGQSWIDMNANLFAALKLEQAAMALLLALFLIVASFSIITSLIMLVKEKTREIAVLMSMGATAQAIRNIFIIQGTIIGIIGTFIGYSLGLLICWTLDTYKLIHLPPDVYPFEYLPILIDWPSITFMSCAVMFLCFVITLYPSRQAARLEPVAALRAE